jgi:hypothetical protein
MTEEEEAVILANRLLEIPYADPDDDLRVLSRQLLRRHEELAQKQLQSVTTAAPQAINARLVSHEWVPNVLSDAQGSVCRNCGLVSEAYYEGHQCNSRYTFQGIPGYPPTARNATASTTANSEATGSGTQECEECESLEEALRVVTEIKNELQADLATTRTALQNAQEALRQYI